MRGNTAGFASASIEAVVRALLDELPELDPARVRAAVERASAKIANAALDTEGHRFVHQRLAQVEATEETTERARILRELAESLEERRDAERALVVRLAAFAEAASPVDLDPLLRLAQITQRWNELPLDDMAALVDINDEATPRRLSEMAEAWQQLGRGYRAADCLERVLALRPADDQAHEALELFYRSTGEWPVLIALLGRRAVHVDDRERAELLREMGLIYERELGDDAGALDAYRDADRLEPDHVDVVDALARLELRVGDSDGEALATLERLARLVHEPARRAFAWLRAAEVARQYDWDRAQALYERARADDPDLVPAIDGLATLLRDRGELAAVIALLVDAAERPALAAERARWLADAADFCVATGDTDRAKRLYREARTADATGQRAGLALVELCWDTGDLADLGPMLDELCRTTVEPGRLRGYLVQRSKLALELGDRATARDTLSRAVELDPHDPVTRRDFADLLFDDQQWPRARELIEGLLDDREDLLQPEVSVELHYRVARCAHQLGDTEGAARHAAVALALAPDHRPALLLRAELDVANPEALLADQLALANLAPPEEKATRFSALGDRYAELGDRATAREMYREALAHRPSDHLLLTKFLGLVADEGDWSYSLDLVQRLIDTETDPRVRARYRHLAAMIARDELDRRDDAAALFAQAIEDDPLLFSAADELEAMVADDPEAVMRFYYRRLEQVRHDEGRRGERLRLWDKLGELCLALERREDAVTAFEVALTLDPDNLDRRQRLADLYLDADPRHAADAIMQHQLVLRGNKRRVASYEALRALYRRTNQPEKARACDDALAIIGMHVVDDNVDALFKPGAAPAAAAGAKRPLGNEDWVALGSGVDVQLSALFALVAPAFVAERARTRPPQPPRELPDQPVPPGVARVLDRVVTMFGIPCPPVYIDPGQVTACTIVLRPQGGALAPAVAIGRPAIDQQLDDGELAFVLARQLADLRNDRFARLLCPRAAELAQIIEVSLAHGADPASHAGRWLATSLHAVEYDQTLALTARLRERGLDPVRAALGWLAATDRAADRIGLVVTGDLATCVRILERERNHASGDPSRILDLVWSSITEEVLGVRGRIERWPVRPRVAADRTA